MNTQLFQSRRFEDKYSVSDEKLSRVLSYLQRFGKKDSHANLSGSYIVTSLYFDTIDLKTYRDYEAGKEKRFKLRFRTYNNDTAGNLEIKFKENRLSYKVATPWELPAEDFSLPKVEDLRPDLRREILKYKLRPVLYTRYERYAFFFSDFRVTLDTNILGGRFINCEEPLFKKVPHNVLEIKGINEYPKVLRDLLDSHRLKRESFSKYAAVVKELHLA